jgi:hypothetical protein
VFGTTPFQILAYGSVLGLELLESGKGKTALVGTAKEVVAKGDRHDKRKWAFKGTEKEIPVLIDQFLVSVRADFPNVLVSSRIPGTGQTQRHDWLKDLRSEDKYNAKISGLVFVNAKVTPPPLLALPRDMTVTYPVGNFLFIG